MTSVAAIGEATLVAMIQRRLAGSTGSVRVGMGDDAAIVRVDGDLVATVDAITAGVDWLPDRTPRRAIGHRAAAVNLSDLAAMGAKPAHLLLALELPAELQLHDLEASLEGLRQLAAAHEVTVIGGDLGIGEGPERWTVTALGHIDCSQPLLRSAAAPGHQLWLIGVTGAAHIGLMALRHDRVTAGLQGCIDAHLWPVPQCAAGQLLARCGETVAAIDISDGLWLDASRMAKASGVVLHLQLGAPTWLSGPVRDFCHEAELDWRRACASGGDDYALLVSCPEGLDLNAMLAPAMAGNPSAATAQIRRVGRVHATEGDPSATLTIEGRRLAGAPRGYQHGQRDTQAG